MLLENTKTDIAVRKIAEKDGQVLAESLGDLTERVTGEKVTEILKKQAKQIVVTLANADADQMLAVLYEKNEREILAGAIAAAKISGADSYVIILPEKMNPESAEKIKKAADEMRIAENLKIIYGSCVKTAYKK